MNDMNISRATLGRLPIYMRYLKAISSLGVKSVSATAMARALGLGEVQVRKDLATVSGSGKPKIGYAVLELLGDLERVMARLAHCRSVIVGAGKLGRALLEYHGFSDFGIEIAAAFDSDSAKCGESESGKTVYPLEMFEQYCTLNDIRAGIITVPSDSAKQVCELMVKCRLKAIWNFAPCVLDVPKGVIVQQENLASSLAYLSLLVNRNNI